jgi:isopentenyl-diphosphate delta-isomerase type 1
MPAEEMLDIVDDQDRVLSRAPRSRVLREYHIHRAVVFFVFDEDGNVLVNQRSDTKDPYPAYWSIACGGHVLAGESYESAVRREVREETGLETPARYIASYQKRTADERENVKVYAVTADREPVLFPDEIQQGRFMSLAEINEMLSRFDFLPETPTLLKILIEHTSRRQT